MDEELIHFLKNIGLGQHINKFSEEEVMSMNTLMILSDAHISSLLPKIGHQAILKDAIQKSKAANLKRNITTASKLKLNKNNSESMKPRIQNFLPGPSSTAFKKYSASPQPDISPQKSYHSGINCDVLECISMNRTGRAILNSYEQNNYLLPSQRKLLVHIVVEHLMQQSTRLVSQHFQLAASNIVRIFPSEAIETYFIPRSGTNGKSCANGLLLKRYKNQRSLLISQGIISKSSDKESYEIFVPLDSVDPSLLIPKREEMEDQVKIEEEPLGFLEEPWSDDSSPYERSSNHSPSPTHDQMSEWDSSKHTQSDLDSISAVNAFIANRTNLVDTEIIHNSFPGPSSGFKRFTDSVNASPPKRFCSDEMTVNCDVRRAIGMSSAGQAILKSYEQNNYLLPTQRKHLVHIVVEHLMQQSSRLLGQHFQIAASNIVKLFPTEAPETYFVPCSESARNSATGMLPTRYKNRRMSLINQGIISKSTSKERSKASSTNDSNDPPMGTPEGYDVMMQDPPMGTPEGNDVMMKAPSAGEVGNRLKDRSNSYQDDPPQNSLPRETDLRLTSEDSSNYVHLRSSCKFKKNGVLNSHLNSPPPGTSSAPARAPSESRRPVAPSTDSCYSGVNCDVLKAISGKSTGLAILKSYEQNNYLLPSQRKHLVHIVVEYMMQQSTRLMGRHFHISASNIVKLFPTEAAETYFIPCSEASRKSASGMLPTRYRNRRAAFISQGILAKNTPKEGCKTSSPDANFEPLPLTTEVRQAVDFLKGRNAATEPWEEVEKAWAESSSFRLNSFGASSRLSSTRDRMEEWPSLKHPRGFRLINMDFEREHPNKSHCLFSKWSKICQPYKEYILAEAAMKRNSTLPLLMESMTNEDGRDVVLFKMMHASCPPVLVRLKDKTIRHPSVRDSEKCFFLHLKDCSSLEAAVSNLKEELKGKTSNPNFPPLIVGVGQNLNALTYFLVHVEGVNFRFDSFLEAVDCCFKIYMVFNLKYPDCAAVFWNFIQKGFYNISTEYDYQNSSISALLSVLNP